MHVILAIFERGVYRYKKYLVREITDVLNLCIHSDSNDNWDMQPKLRELKSTFLKDM